MKKLNRFQVIVGLLIVTMIGLAISGGFLGVSLGGYLNRMEAEIEHSHEHEHIEDAHSLVATGTYYKNGSSFYTYNGAHYHCTNSSHSGSNDYTTSSVSGTCYQTSTTHSYGYTTAYYGHSCSKQYGSHSVSSSTSYTYGNHVVSSSTTYTYGAHTPAYGYNNIPGLSCTTCGERLYSGMPNPNTCYSNITGSSKTYSCSKCGKTSSSSFSGTCTSNVTSSTTTYKCSYCNKTSSSSFSGTCTSNVTGYKCSYCGSTFSSNSTASCSSRSYKKCDNCGGNWNNCSCSYTTTTNHNHSISLYYYSYTDIDTGATVSPTSQYTQATGFTTKFNINNANAVVTTGTTGGSTADQYMLHGHSEALRSNGFTFAGHRFAGWATSAGSSASPATATYSNGQAISLSTSNVSSGGTYNLYAVWLYEVPKPTATGGTAYSYDPGGRTHAVSNFNTNYMTRSGSPSGTNVGSYSVTYTLKTGYCWSDGTTSPVTLNWSIVPAELSVPTISANPTYTGQSVSPTLSGFSDATMTKSGTLTAINVSTSGNYAITIALKDKTNYVWKIGNTSTTTNDQTIYWNVAPKDIGAGGITITIPQDSYVYDGNPKTPEPSVTT